MMLIPRPISMLPGEGACTLTADTTIYVALPTSELLAAGHYLAGRLRPATGYALPVETARNSAPAAGLLLTTIDADPALGEEGYDLRVTPEGVVLCAPQAAGLFYGVQTLRQLLPPAIERPTVQPGPWRLPAVTIRDQPRFAWRGVMLDVARHFFSVDDVKRLIDLAAAYKLNRLHLHLTDDQGWRIEINSWPDLARLGGRTAVGGGPGGYYTQADYADLVAYAAARHVTVVPEIDMPGHTHAALAAYPSLNGGVALALYTETQVGFSSLRLDEEITYRFVEDVVAELAALTPGDYLHIGGDEAFATPPADYARFIERIEAVVAADGKRMVGWEEIGKARLRPTSVAQHWVSTHALDAARQGAKIIMSPANRTYCDMKYDAATPLGLNWAGCLDVQTAYDWDPATHLPGLTEDDVLGVEAPLWTETLTTRADIEYMLFPRLLGLAEIGWSPAAGRDWDEYRARLAAHGPRLDSMEVNFHRSAEVAWL